MNVPNVVFRKFTDNGELFVIINGRQAIDEGPRRIGHCIYCKGLCRGSNPLCDLRVFSEAQLERAKRERKPR